MRNTGGKRAKSDKRAALPSSRLDGARGAIETGDEVRTERKPGVGAIAQHLRRDPQYPAVTRSSASREVGSVLIPGAEPASPAPRHIHPGNDVVLPANMPDEINGTVDQHPPEVRILALPKQVDAGLDGNLSAARDQIGELIICQTIEDAQRAKIISQHQIVAR